MQVLQNKSGLSSFRSIPLSFQPSTSVKFQHAQSMSFRGHKIQTSSIFSLPCWTNLSAKCLHTSLVTYSSVKPQRTSTQTPTASPNKEEAVEISTEKSPTATSNDLASCYPGHIKSPFTTKFEIVKPPPPIPTYRVLDEDGRVLNEKDDPQFPAETLLKIYRLMVTVNIMDTILYEVQRQGRISFYMTAYGEEATHLGTAAALDMGDTVYAQYREVGVLLWRGFGLEDVTNQCYSNWKDGGKGRQMPVHYGSKAHNFQTISSPLATQIPHAAGAGYASRLRGEQQCVICYFGEGAASEGDFHAALNFASTLGSQTIFFCRNNGWAISTPSSEQYKGDGIAARGLAYGMDTIRVDGNDVFAVYNATKAAKQLIVQERKPVLIEAMTYRVGHHSTSDDSTRYRTSAEVEVWKEKYHPILRLRLYLLRKNLWSEEQEKSLRVEIRKHVLEALQRAEVEKKPPIEELFTDVYDTIPPHLLEQKKELYEHLSKYPESYPIELHKKSHS